MGTFFSELRRFDTMLCKRIALPSVELVSASSLFRTLREKIPLPFFKPDAASKLLTFLRPITDLHIIYSGIDHFQKSEEIIEVSAVLNFLVTTPSILKTDNIDLAKLFLNVVQPNINTEKDLLNALWGACYLAIGGKDILHSLTTQNAQETRDSLPFFYNFIAGKTHSEKGVYFHKEFCDHVSDALTHVLSQWVPSTSSIQKIPISELSKPDLFSKTLAYLVDPAVQTTPLSLQETEALVIMIYQDYPTQAKSILTILSTLDSSEKDKLAALLTAHPLLPHLENQVGTILGTLRTGREWFKANFTSFLAGSVTDQEHSHVRSIFGAIPPVLLGKVYSLIENTPHAVEIVGSIVQKMDTDTFGKFIIDIMPFNPSLATDLLKIPVLFQKFHSYLENADTNDISLIATCLRGHVASKDLETWKNQVKSTPSFCKALCKLCGELLVDTPAEFKAFFRSLTQASYVDSSDQLAVRDHLVAMLKILIQQQSPLLHEDAFLDLANSSANDSFSELVKNPLTHPFLLAIAKKDPEIQKKLQKEIETLKVPGSQWPFTGELSFDAILPEKIAKKFWRKTFRATLEQMRLNTPDSVSSFVRALKQVPIEDAVKHIRAHPDLHESLNKAPLEDAAKEPTLVPFFKALLPLLSFSDTTQLALLPTVFEGKHTHSVDKAFYMSVLEKRDDRDAVKAKLAELTAAQIKVICASNKMRTLTVTFYPDVIAQWAQDGKFTQAQMVSLLTNTTSTTLLKSPTPFEQSYLQKIMDSLFQDEAKKNKAIVFLLPLIFNFNSSKEALMKFTLPSTNEKLRAERNSTQILENTAKWIGSLPKKKTLPKLVYSIRSFSPFDSHFSTLFNVKTTPIYIVKQYLQEYFSSGIKASFEFKFVRDYLASLKCQSDFDTLLSIQRVRRAIKSRINDLATPSDGTTLDVSTHKDTIKKLVGYYFEWLLSEKKLHRYGKKFPQQMKTLLRDLDNSAKFMQAKGKSNWWSLAKPLSEQLNITKKIDPHPHSTI